MKVITQHEEYLSKQIVDIAYDIYKDWGQGLVQKVYKACVCFKLKKSNIACVILQQLSLVYDHLPFAESLRPYFLVDELIIIELKAQQTYPTVWQFFNYLKLTNNNLGFLINFTVPLCKDGNKKMLLT